MKNKKIKKIYTIVLEWPEEKYLSCQMASSLEEAFFLALQEHENFFPGEGSQFPKIENFLAKTIEQLERDSKRLKEEYIAEHNANKKIRLSKKKESLKESKEPVGTKEPVESIEGIKKKSKNDLMKEIIKRKDSTLFEKNIKLFTVAEKNYLRAQIKG